MNDNVTRPAHYTSGDIECIDAIRASMSEEEFQGYCKGAVLKYVWRWRQKGGVEDLRKAGVYLGWLIESVEGSAVAVRRAPHDYPWHEAPDWANGAVRAGHGFVVWVEKEPDWNTEKGDFVWPERSDVFWADYHPMAEWPNSWRPRPAHKVEDSKDGEMRTLYPWHIAPTKATHAAMDHDGNMYWYTEEPRICGDRDYWKGAIHSKINRNRLWRQSLEARP